MKLPYAIKLTTLRRNMHLLIPFLILLSACCCGAGKISRPLGEEEIKLVLKEFNSQGIILTQLMDETAKSDEIEGYAPEYGYFWFDFDDYGDGMYLLYRADINNDRKDEYILATVSGSGGFFRIDAVYQTKEGKLKDIYHEISIPLWRFIKGNEEQYDDYLGGGNIIIEEEKDKTFFTLKEHARNYSVDGFEYYPPKKWKFLWENGNIRLIK